MDSRHHGRGDRPTRAQGRLARGAAVALILPFYLAWDATRWLVGAVERASDASWRWVVSSVVRIPVWLGSAVEPLAVATDGVVGRTAMGIGLFADGAGRAIRAIWAPIGGALRAAAVAGVRALAAIGRSLTTVGRAIAWALAPIDRAIDAFARAVGAAITSAVAAIQRGIAWIGLVVAPLVRAATQFLDIMGLGLRRIARSAWLAMTMVAAAIARVVGRVATLFVTGYRVLRRIVAWIVGIVGPPIDRVVRFVLAIVRSVASVTRRAVARLWRATGVAARWVAQHSVVPFVDTIDQAARTVSRAVGRFMEPVVRQIGLIVRATRDATRSALRSVGRTRSDTVAIIRNLLGRPIHAPKPGIKPIQPREAASLPFEPSTLPGV